MNKQTAQQQVVQEEIPQELIMKFDGDQQLVQEFISQGHSIEELKGSSIIHATRYDPLVVLDTGETIGFYISAPNRAQYQDNSRVYQNRTNKFFK